MNKTKVILFFLFVILILSGLSLANYYSNPSAAITYTLNPDGSVKVHEEIVFDIFCSSSDCYHELYTWHPQGLSISSPFGYCKETNCKFFTQYNQGKYELVLRKDEGFSRGRYTAVFDYVLNGEILEQKDTAQFFYKIWYDQWPNQIGDLKIEVIFPNPINNITYFIHAKPYYKVENRTNSIFISASDYPANSYLEINALMPKEWFSNLRKAPNYMSKEEIVSQYYYDKEKGRYAPNYMSKEEIIKGEQECRTFCDISFFDIFFWGFVIFLLFPYISLIIIYFIYGREQYNPEVEALPPYIRNIEEIDSDLSPIYARSYLEPGFANNQDAMGQAIAGEILFLVNEGYLEIKEEKKRGLLGQYNEYYLKIVEGKDTSKLNEAQKKLISFIKKYSVNGYFSFTNPSGSKNFIENAFFSRIIVDIEKDIEKLVNNLNSIVSRYLKDKNAIDTSGRDLYRKIASILSTIIFIIFPFLTILTLKAI